MSVSFPEDVADYSSEYGTVEVELGLHIVRITRSDVPFPDVYVMERCFADIAATVDRIGRTRWALLIDVRRARGTNAPGFEQALMRATNPILVGWPKVAVVVRTAAGVLQLKRQIRPFGPSHEVFQDEQAALAFLSVWWTEAARLR